MPAGQPDANACVFCRIVAGVEPATIEEIGTYHLVIEPIGPHAPGHVLVIPTAHLGDATASPNFTGHLFAEATKYARKRHQSFNLLTSVGEAATQSVFHLHVHVIPRGADDGLPPRWPWLP